LARVRDEKAGALLSEHAKPRVERSDTIQAIRPGSRGQANDGEPGTCDRIPPFPDFFTFYILHFFTFFC